ncbi:MAG: signal peptidase I, partial [Lachnospiraceae bacterium]|nr:signal peptidase I [Lachnospiraceae bacterium]
AADVIRARRIALNTREGYINLFFRVVVLALTAYVIFTQVFLITQNKGQGMFPAIKDGDLIIGYRLQQEYAKNDVVVYTVNGEQRVGRIIGRPTDVVTISDTGSLLVNGTTQTGEILYPTYAKEGLGYPYRVPEGQIFILGDYRTNAEDSRDHGPVIMEHVKGKVITILRRRGL